MTKILRWIMTAAGIAATGALAAGSVEYYDPVGKTNATCSVYVAYTSQTTLTSGWYVVSGVITNWNHITVNGDANLILCDSSELAAMRGVTVDVRNSITNSLTIWAQSTNSVAGKLTATGGDWCAGIGGGEEGAGGNVTINGGVVTAHGDIGGAGIGGGKEGDGGNVTINGGEVTAKGGGMAAGIGGGDSGGAGGNVTINGGVVTAHGDTGGAGIGGGESGAGGTVTINGGEVTATGNFGAGIGGGDSGNGGTVTINGGEVTATGGDTGGAGIGGGDSGGAGGNVTIKGGKVTATGGVMAAGIGGGHNSSTDGELDIFGMKVGYADGNGNVISWAATSERMAYCRNREGKTVRLAVCEHKDDDDDGVCDVCGLLYGPIRYYDPVGKTNATCSVYVVYTSQTELTTGWYVVSGVITNGTRITVNGDVNLILRDNSELAAMSGVTVDVKNSITNSLTIWAQSTNSVAGKLTASGEYGGAGIGGGDRGSGGTVTINGGKVKATGGGAAAGIGGGQEGDGGTVTINGGTVKAQGGWGGAGIGGGRGGVGGTVTINGGVVEAQGGSWGAGIGGGRLGDGGTVTINGGTVTATGGGGAVGGAGIGGANSSSSDGELFIPGMKVGYVNGSGEVEDWVAADSRVAACRNKDGKTVRLEECQHKDDDNDGICDDCGGVPYFDPTDAEKPTKLCANYVAYTNQTELSTGWYVVSGVITNGTRITVNGDANLILCDNSELAATNGVNVDVSNSITNSLTIWAQSTNSVSGKLTANGGCDSAAGIGGGDGGTGGTVTINGGKVSAEGAINGAGIGGGNGGAGGTVTINCGTVSATGGGYGAGIGGGNGGIGGTVTVNGGTVEAVGAFCGAGIGGGGWSAGGTVTINGGEVTVSGYAGAGIGGGYQCGSHGGLQIYDRAKVAAGENEANAALVAPTERVDACRMPYAKIEPCKDHHYEYGYCEFCGDTLPASVANVVARQRWPWNGLVDIEYDVSGDTVGLKAEISFVEQGGEARTWTATRFVDGFAPRAERGHHHAVWDTSSDGATNIVARVKAVVKLRKEN